MSEFFKIKKILFLFIIFHNFSAYSENKIVTLAPNLTEIVYALGLGSQLVGDTDLCDYPPEALSVNKIGHYNNFSLEKILDSGANIVLATDGNPISKLNNLEKFGITIIRVSPKNAEDLSSIIEIISKNLNVEKAGQDLSAKIENSLTKLKEKKNKGKTFFLALQFDPVYSMSDETWIGDIFKISGLVNIVGKSKIPYPVVSQEFLIKNKPDIFLVARIEGKSEKESLDIQKENVKKIYGKEVVRVVMIPKDVLVRPGPRIVDGIKFIEGL